MRRILGWWFPWTSCPPLGGSGLSPGAGLWQTAEGHRAGEPEILNLKFIICVIAINILNKGVANNRMLGGSDTEVLEGSSGEDEIEDETFARIVRKSRTRRGEEFFPFPRPFRGRDEEFLGISAFFSAILRTRLLILVFRGRGRDEARNFAPFLGHFEVETRPSRTSAICPIHV